MPGATTKGFPEMNLKKHLAMGAVDRAKSSRGKSSDSIYRMVARAISTRRPENAAHLLDIGCGTGDLHPYVVGLVGQYHGADILRYEGLPAGCHFLELDLDGGRVPLPDESMDIVVAVETIEHLENPRALMREMRRLTRSGGLLIVTTPNQLSLLSKLTLLTKNQFNAFQQAPGLYPAHITALLEIDLIRIAQELALEKISILYSETGRVPLTTWHYPFNSWLPGRPFSDNLALSACRA